MSCDGLLMSVRAIPKNYRNLTGLSFSQKADKPFFESTLERDLLTVVEFDPNVQSFDVQPVCISWKDSKGKLREYTPDILIQYHHGSCQYSSKDIVLGEVKYRSDIEKNWNDLKPKFKAAIQFAKAKGWRFKLFTEQEIRTTYMENARFLLPYLTQELDGDNEQLILDRLTQVRECSVDGLIKSIFNDKWSQAELLPSVWFLIAAKRICTDLALPLTMSSRIWVER